MQPQQVVTGTQKDHFIFVHFFSESDLEVEFSYTQGIIATLNLGVGGDEGSV